MAPSNKKGKKRRCARSEPEAFTQRTEESMTNPDNGEEEGNEGSLPPLIDPTENENQSVNGSEIPPNLRLTHLTVDNHRDGEDLSSFGDSQQTHQTCVIEITNQAIKQKLDSRIDDCRAIITTRVSTQIFPKMKFPDLEHPRAAKKVKKMMMEALNKPMEEIELQWATIKSIILSIVRHKRAYLVQIMKTMYMGECACSCYCQQSNSLTLFVPGFTDWLKEWEDDEDVILYTRYHFLLFDVPGETVRSIETRQNRNLYARLKEKIDKRTSMEDECEKYGDWAGFPDSFPNWFQDRDLTRNDNAIAFLAWMLHVFVRSVVCAEKKAKYCKVLEKEGMEFIQLDDFAFIYSICQNNIDKWRLLHQATKKGKITSKNEKDYTEEEKEVIKKINEHGYEFNNGMGLSGGEGKHRRETITKILHQLFYDADQPWHEANRKALETKLKEMADLEKQRNPHEHLSQEGDTTDDAASNKKRKVTPKRDAVLDSIYDDIWGV